MKKLLLVLAIGAFVACNDAGTGEGEKKDSTATQTAPPDSSTVTPDSTKVDTAAVKAVDTTVKK